MYTHVEYLEFWIKLQNCWRCVYFSYRGNIYKQEGRFSNSFPDSANPCLEFFRGAGMKTRPRLW